MLAKRIYFPSDSVMDMFSVRALYCNENVPELVELQGVLQYSIVVKSSDVFVCGIEHQSIAVVQTRRYRDVYRTSSFLSNIMVWPC